MEAENPTVPRCSRLVWLALCLAYSAPGLALEPGADGSHGRGLAIEALIVGAEPGGSREGAVFRANVYRRGPAMRVDLAHESVPEGYVIQRSPGEPGWFVLTGLEQMLPMPTDAYRGLWVDAGEPCRAWPGYCDRTGAREIAGRQVQGWRIRNARDRGPGGMSQGEFWVDEEWGLILGYRGTTRRGGHAREMHVLHVGESELDRELFALPGASPQGL
jgi:hypothetical protein